MPVIDTQPQAPSPKPVMPDSEPRTIGLSDPDSVLRSPDSFGPSDRPPYLRTSIPDSALRAPNSSPILLLVTSQDWGGVQAFLFDLALEMKTRGLPVKIVAGRPNLNNPRHPELVSGSKTNLSKMPNQVRHDESRAPVSGLSRTIGPAIEPSDPHVELRAPSSLGPSDRPPDHRTIGRELGSRCLSAGIPFIELRHMARDINPWTNFLSLIELIKLFRREKPQSVHLNSTMMGVVGSLAARLTSVPWTIYCIGGWVFNEQLPTWKKKLYIWIEKISARWKDVIVCVHPGDEQLARELNIKPRHLLTTVPNGIDVAAFEKQLLDRTAARAALAERSTLYDVRVTIVGTVANAYPPKNLIWYLDVCKIAHDQNPDIRFVIIGDGPLMDDLRRKHAELKLDDYVLLAGRRMDAKKLYRAFDTFVLPSTKEGMSITLLEAMAAHVPIIATDVGANRWMLTASPSDHRAIGLSDQSPRTLGPSDQSPPTLGPVPSDPRTSAPSYTVPRTPYPATSAGLIVPPNDKQRLTDAILTLVGDENLRQKYADNAYNQVRQRFTWEQTVEGTLKTLLPPSS